MHARPHRWSQHPKISLKNRAAFRLVILLGGLIGCTPEAPPSPAAPPAATVAAPAGAITLATTTSTQDSGLLDLLVPRFEKETGITVKVVAVGSGQALQLGRRGDADLLLTHSPADEEKFVAEGHAAARQLVMHNDFVLVGPASDPAEIRASKSAAAALIRIAEAQSPFVSRGDDSGTHRKEQALWKAAEVVPQGDWYHAGGGGMAETLRIANEKSAYTVSDRGTYLAQRASLQLAVLRQGDPLLWNQYAVLVIDPQTRPGGNVEGAKKFAEFLLSPEVQRMIGEFGKEKYGQPLFFPEYAGPPQE